MNPDGRDSERLPLFRVKSRREEPMVGAKGLEPLTSWV